MDLIVQLGKLLSSTWRVRSLEDVLWYIGEQETLDNYSEYQGKIEHFCYLEQASNTRQVLEAKKFCSWYFLCGLSKQEARVNLF